MNQSNKGKEPLYRHLVAFVIISLVALTTLGAPSIAHADEITKHENERDAANSRADEAQQSREEAASRAEEAEAQRDAANAAAESTQKELEAASAKLDELFANVEMAYAELSKAVYDLDVVKGEIEEIEQKIEETKQELAEEQENLSQQISITYKNGPAQWLEIALDATSFEDFISRLVYANKITEQYENTVAKVKELRAQLEAELEELNVKKAEQEELVAIKEAKAAEAEQAEAAQEAFVNSLSAELRAALDEAREAEAVAAQARAAEAQYAAEEEKARAEAAEQQRLADAERTAQMLRQNAGSYNNVDIAPYIQSAATGDQRSTAVNAALSQVGLPYIWGSESPGVGFDCNSLTHWAWGVAGVSIPYPSGTYMYGQFQWMKASGHWVYNVSDLQLGDLVFYSHNGGASTFHVAMYIGGGQVVHAHSYRLGVTVTDINAVNGFCGGGSPI